ncbi:L-lactate permease [Testudinibacter sp. TR-2022]|uniref:L-lactate permease n=1 Tax=Testudinibacter sp. TR-2022 TaxID=2585029 RepID=UPI00111BCCDB|nr:L-lactate permease [Testudinibacter sp. TR-2022]TNH03710.1 L-lactate permease [Pasteurellaceae bacterium Phil31]TNH07634.1 L-lactate permease [Testudinibacter sp. TR-2022]TNH09212.1 L-lactate permease [Testudinibacter sp. TR-2022]TNH16465.1 L-lactate permease [Testudinibacter sp. TR-2022]TNH16930.1 L-lactate permease [Testudinibacter sp. TR-2022]
MALTLSLFPIVLLIYLMVKRNSMPSFIALPLIALLVYVLQLTYFGQDFMLINANVISGIIATQTPVTIIFGAILFNRMMEISGSTNVLRQWLSNINPNPIAQLMIIGWAFAFMIEGASGFGTPAAIAAPILVGLGFNPIKVAIFALVMNSVPVSFGAVGTPTWFGFAPLKLGEETLLQIGYQSAIIHFFAAFVIPLIALRFITNWTAIRNNIVFIYLSVLSCTIPYLLLAKVNYEFPSLVGGAIGLFISILLANKGIGLVKTSDNSEKSPLPFATIVKAMTPTMLLILILIVTRIHQLGIKALLNDATTWFNLSLGQFGQFEVSRALILSFKDILGQGVSDSYKTLYVPSLIPFIITVLISLVLFKVNKNNAKAIFSSTFQQTKKPFFALIGALIMVKLMLLGGENSMVQTIGRDFAAATGANWTYFSAYLGAIGAFFSGSNTVSNLTFGGIQYSIAQTTALSVPLVLALQSVGGAMGNMVCINNVIAVCSVLDVKNQEGAIIKKTVIPMLVYGVIAALVATLILS